MQRNDSRIQSSPQNHLVGFDPDSPPRVTWIHTTIGARHHGFVCRRLRAVVSARPVTRNVRVPPVT